MHQVVGSGSCSSRRLGVTRVMVGVLALVAWAFGACGVVHGQELPQCVYELIADDPPSYCSHNFGAGAHLSSAICGTGPLSPTHGVGYQFYISLGGVNGLVQSVEVQGVPATVTLEAIEPGSIVGINFEGYGHARIIVHGDGCTFTHELDVVNSLEDPLNCGPHIQLCDQPGPIPYPNEEPPTVCPGSVLCLRAAGWCNACQYWLVNGNAVILGPDDDETVWVQFTEPGYAGVECAGTDGGVLFHVLDWSLAVDLDVDSDNNNGFSAPGRTTAEENIEDDATKPGKVVFVSGDEDGDGVPDYADGIGELNGGNGGSVAHFTPIKLQLPTDDIAHTSFWVDYNASDPAGVHIDYDYPPDWGMGGQWKPADVGRLRLWTTDAGDVRSFQGFPTGGYVAPNVAYDLADFQAKGLINHGVITLWVEAVKPSPEQGAEEIQVFVEKASTTGDCVASGHDEVRVTAAELEVQDLRAWGPVWVPAALGSETDGTLSLTNTDLKRALGTDHQVDGAITDGASACVVRIQPTVTDASISNLQLSVAKPDNTLLSGDSSSSDSKIVGTTSPVLSGQPLTLPDLPTSWPPPAASAINFTSGVCFYVPPESYVNPDWTYVAPSGWQGDQEFPVELRISQNGSLLGVKRFLLRRPPLVFAHGIMSDPNTWDLNVWGEIGDTLPTRHYFVDYSCTAHQGYSENYRHVAYMIELALREYRTGSDSTTYSDYCFNYPLIGHPNPQVTLTHDASRSLHGRKYAATRADVIGHSQDGQVSRWYTARIETSGPISRDGEWPLVDMTPRHDPFEVGFEDDDGRYEYLRSDNFGAGAIRRLITLGSPFRGSPLASIGAAMTERTTTNLANLRGWAQDTSVTGMPDDLENRLFPQGSGIGMPYSDPTCAVDLKELSRSCRILNGVLDLQHGNYSGSPVHAQYPLGNRGVRWFAMVGLGTEADQTNYTFAQSGLLVLLSLADSATSPYHDFHIFTIGNFITQAGNGWLTSSDLIVPASSQRNSNTVRLNEQDYYLHTHSAPLPNNNETTSPMMAHDARIVLYSFPTGITLSPMDVGGQSITGVVGPRQFEPLAVDPNYGSQP